MTTNLESSENSTFTVYGQVRQPGVYPVVGEGTLMKAVATARGLAEYGNSREVIVFRTVDGQRLATLYNLDAISRGAYTDPRIYPNDTIVVGDSQARRLFDDITSVARHSGRAGDPCSHPVIRRPIRHEREPRPRARPRPRRSNFRQ